MKLKTILIAGMALCFLDTSAPGARADGGQAVARPVLPRTCSVLRAPLRIGRDGPLAGDTPAAEDETSRTETQVVQQRLENCAKGEAVELALGASPGEAAFLLRPVHVPAGVSLIVDGGVTVYASRNPANFQNHQELQYRCGQVGLGYPVYGGCRALITLLSHSGLYGQGVLDGQGERGFISGGRFVEETWWDLLDRKTEGKCAHGGCEQASPLMVSAGVREDGSLGSSLVLSGITIRNPPFHTTRVAGAELTIWGVNVQAPWNLPNSDGFDVHGQDIVFWRDTVANGDQDIAITSTGAPTSRMLIEGLTAYGKGGVALLADGPGVTDLLVDDMAMTGDVPSFVPCASCGPGGSPDALVNGVDVLAAKLRRQPGRLASYGQALPTATHDLQGLQINSNIGGSYAGATAFTNIAFRGVCLQDIVQPVHLGPLKPFTASSQVPAVDGVSFSDLHVLQPTEQYPSMKSGIVVTPEASGTYESVFESYPAGGLYNTLLFDRVVFDDLPSGDTSLATLSAEGNLLSTFGNIYPGALNRWDGPSPPPGLPEWTLTKNVYGVKTGTSKPGPARQCPASRWSFLLGDLSIDRSASVNGPTGGDQEQAVIPAGGSVTLDAVLQPAMSQTTWFRRNAYGADPGLLAVGAPPLTNAVDILEDGRLVGRARLGANGTLASVKVGPVAEGTHRYTAFYPADRHYRSFAFGTVTVTAR